MSTRDGFVFRHAVLRVGLGSVNVWAYASTRLALARLAWRKTLPVSMLREGHLQAP